MANYINHQQARQGIEGAIARRQYNNSLEGSLNNTIQNTLRDKIGLDTLENDQKSIANRLVENIEKVKREEYVDPKEYDSLVAEAESVGKRLGYLRNYLRNADPNNAEAIKEATDASKNFLDASKAMADQQKFYSAFKDADDYKKQMDAYKEQQRLTFEYDLNAGKKLVDAAKGTRDYDALKNEYDLAKYYQTAYGYDKLTENEDFDKKSKKAKSTWDVGETARAADYINGKWYAKVGDTISEIADAINIFGNDETVDAYNRYDFMTDDQVKTFNYIYNTEGQKKAQAYLDFIEGELAQKYAQKNKTSNFFVNAIRALNSGTESIGEGLENLGLGVIKEGAEMFTGGKTGAFGKAVDSRIKENVAASNNALALAARQKDAGTVERFFYDVAQTIPTTLVNMFLPGGFVVTSLSAAGNAYADATAEDKNSMQRIFMAIGEGSMEALTNLAQAKLGGDALDAFVDTATKNMGKTLGKVVAGNFIRYGYHGVSEGLEEAIQEIAGTELRNVVYREENDINWKDVGRSFLLGATSAEMLQSPNLVRGIYSDIKLPPPTAENFKETLDTAPKGSTLAERFEALTDNLGVQDTLMSATAIANVIEGNTDKAVNMIDDQIATYKYAKEYAKQNIGVKSDYFDGQVSMLETMKKLIGDGKFNAEAARNATMQNTSLWQVAAENNDTVAKTMLDDALSNKKIEKNVLTDKGTMKAFYRLTGTDLSQFKTVTQKRNAVKVASDAYKAFATSDAAKQVSEILKANNNQTDATVRSENRINAQKVLEEAYKLAANEDQQARNSGNVDGAKIAQAKMKLIDHVKNDVRNGNVLSFASLDGSAAVNNARKYTESKSENKTASATTGTKSAVASTTTVEEDYKNAFNALSDDTRKILAMKGKEETTVGGKSHKLSTRDVINLAAQSINRRIEEAKGVLSDKNSTKEQKAEAKKLLKELKEEAKKLNYFDRLYIQAQTEIEQQRIFENEVMVSGRVEAVKKFLKKFGIDLELELGGVWYTDGDGSAMTEEEGKKALARGESVVRHTKNGLQTAWTVKIMSALAQGNIKYFDGKNMVTKRIGYGAGEVSPERAVDIVIGHELVHFVKTNASNDGAKKLYQDIIKAIEGSRYDETFDLAHKSGDKNTDAQKNWDDLKSLYVNAEMSHNKSLTREQAEARVDEDYILEEIAADYMGSLFAGNGVITTINMQSNFFERIWEWLTKLSRRYSDSGLDRQERVDLLAKKLKKLAERAYGGQEKLTKKKAEVEAKDKETREAEMAERTARREQARAAREAQKSTQSEAKTEDEQTPAETEKRAENEEKMMVVGENAETADLSVAESDGYIPPSDAVRFNVSAIPEHKANLETKYTSDSAVELNTLMNRYDKIIETWDRLGGELNSKFLNEWNEKKGKDRAFTIFKAQSGYKYNVELSSMCKKGVPLFEAIDYIVREELMKELNVDTLGKAEKEILYDILSDKGFDIPCAICYVEQARQREGDIINAFLNGNDKNKLGWNQVLDRVQAEMKQNGVEYEFKTADRSITTDKYTSEYEAMDEDTQNAFYSALQKLANEEITRYNEETREVNLKRKIRPLIKSVTPTAIKNSLGGNASANLKIFNVLFTEQNSRFRMDSDILYSSMTTSNLKGHHSKLYSLFNQQGGVSGYKTKQAPVIYVGDILNKKWKASDLRITGGVRNQSNSDFQMYTLMDQAQMYIDFTAKGYYMQAYTKVLSELKLFGLSNSKINASLIPKVKVYYNSDGTVDFEKTMDTAGLDENGNPLYDDIEGINHDEAFMLISDPAYSKSIGGVCIGYSDKHIFKLLDDPRIQLIIGFHDKTNNPDERYRGARYAKNYNGENEAVKYNPDGTTETVHIGFNQFVQKAEKKFTFDEKTETYSGTTTFNDKTYTANDIPKLAADLYLDMCANKGYTPAYNTFKGHENYYKLLADFSLYDSQGNYAPHRKVAYNMPDQVPYLENGKKKYMDSEKYIKDELAKEMKVRDDVSEALSDKSEDGIIPQFIKRVNERDGKMSVTEAMDNDYLDAVENGDMETAQRMVDEAAKAAGYTPVTRFHQTGARFTRFSNENPDAGLNDSDTPNGYFFKTNDHDIGVGADFVKTGRGGNIQMAVYLKANNMLHFKNREDAQKWYSENVPGYKETLRKYDEHLKEFDRISKETNEKMFAELVALEESGKSTTELDLEIMDKYDKIVDDWISDTEEYSTGLRAQMRQQLNDYFLKNDSGFDGIEIDDDGHRYIDKKREDVHTFIVFDNKQIKSADPVTYDGNGNVIPLSERFNEKNEDIRWMVSPSLDSDIDSVLNGTFDASKNEVYLGETSQFMTDVIGAKSLALYMPAAKVYSSIMTRDEYNKKPYYAEQDNYHGIGKEDFIDILERSENPIAAFASAPDEKGNKRLNRIVLVTDKIIKDAETGEEGYAVVVEEVDTTARTGGKQVKANKAITVYPRTKLNYDISDAISDGRLLDITKKGEQLFAGRRGSNPQATIQKAVLKKNIADFWANVKWANEKNKIYSSSTTPTTTAMEDAIKKSSYYKSMQNSEKDTDGRVSVTEEVLDGSDFQSYSEMIAETKANKQNNSALVEKLLKERGTRIDGTSVRKFLNGIIGSYGSEAWYGNVEKKFREMFQKVYNNKGGKVDTNSVVEMFRDIATVIFDGTTENEIETLVKDIRATEIKVSDSVKAEFGEDWNDFRMKNFGNLSLRNEKGESINEVYKKLSESHPELFSTEVTDEVEQLKIIADVTSKIRAELKTRVYNEAQENIIERITTDLIEGTMSLDPQILYSYNANNKSKDYYKRRIEDLKKAHEEWTEKVMENISAKNERQRIAYDKKMVYKRLKSLGSALFTPKKSNHIPESMRNDVAALFRKFKFPETTTADIGMAQYFAQFLSQNNDGKESEFDSFPPSIADLLKNTSSFDLANMTASEMHELSQILRAVTQAINQEDKLYHSKESAEALALSAIRNIAVAKGNRTKIGKFIGAVRNWIGLGVWDAEGLFNYIGIPELHELFTRVADGQDTFASVLTELAGEMGTIVNGKIPREWRTETVEIKLDNELSLNFTKAQIMSLYLLDKQADSRKRLLDLNGGIQLTKTDVKELSEKNKDAAGAKKKFLEAIAPTKTVLGKESTLTEADLDKILSEKYLTDEMKEIADKISKLLNGKIADMLNVVSLKLDGYKRFGINEYFPMIVASSAKNKDGVIDLMGAQYDALMTAKGFTLDRTGSSGVKLVVDDIFSVMDRHMLGVSQYIGYESALRDFMKVYTGRFGNTSLKERIKEQMGENATKAIDNFLKGVQGRQMKAGDEKLLSESLFGNYKAAQVALNMSVVAKQPTAILRAMPEFSMKGIKAMAKNPKKADIEEMIKHSGLAKMKKWGYSENTSSKSIRQLYDENSLEWRDKMNDLPVFNWAEKADEHTWGRIWLACRAETNTIEEATKKFNDVIRKTQVVNTATTASPIVNQSFFTKLVFAFKNEPLKTFNYTRAAVQDFVRGKEGSGKHLTKVLTMNAINTAVVAAITTAFSMMRDDEDDDMEKFFDKLHENAVQDMLSTVTIFAGDVMEAFNAAENNRTVERADLAVMTDAIQLWDKIVSGKFKASGKSDVQAIYEMSGVVSSITGLPIKTVLRSLKTTGNNVVAMIDDPYADYLWEQVFYNVDADASQKRFASILTEALDKDFETYSKIKNDLVKHGYGQSRIDGAVKNSDRFVNAWNKGADAFRKELNEAQKYDKMFTSDYVISQIRSRRNGLVTELYKAILDGNEKVAASKTKELLEFRNPDTKKPTTQKELDALVQSKLKSAVKSDVSNILVAGYGTPQYKANVERLLEKYKNFEEVNEEYIDKLARSLS